MYFSVTSFFGVFVRRWLLRLGAILALCLMALGAYAAPYADLVIDARTGEVLHSDNADTRLHPASLTKMMTLYIAFEAVERGEISLDSMVTISASAAAEPPSKLGLKPGQKIALRYLIRAAAIKSANDAATAIGEAIEGSEARFARRMNRTAKALGMTRTTFKNAHGLTEEGHLSTARDMTMLGRRLFYDYPQYYHIFSRRTADAGVAQVSHTNSRFLAAYEGADGIKTGYTVAAGFNLVASAQRGNKRIITTVFGGRSTATRNARVAELMDIGFGLAPNKARTKKPDAPDYAALDAPVPNGEPSSDPLASGKKIRVSGAVQKSPRPRGRPAAPAPAAPEVLLAMQYDIDLVLAEVQGVPAAAEPALMEPEVLSVLASVPMPAPRPAAIEALVAETAAPEVAAEDTAVALAAALSETSVLASAEPAVDPVAPVLVQTTVPQPETLLLAEMGVTNVPARAADAAGEALALAAVMGSPDMVTRSAPLTAPLARPGDQDELKLSTVALAFAEPAQVVTPVLVPDPVVVEPVQTRLAALAASAPPARPAAVVALAQADISGSAPMTPTDVMLAALQQVGETDGTGAAALAPVTPDYTVVASVAPPPTRPAEIVLTAVQLPQPDPDAPEIVARISTSGGRLHAINIGRFASRYEAERVLMKTALAEMETLGDSLRKVIPRKGGFEAAFVGLSEDEAGLACRRLTARGGTCAVVTP